ncbi:MAG TPA: NADH-quinone oxidoreductase subunit L [Acidisarcina sp.]|nr:NADH-quinone oxidoreductase subunit L [Acidisarcina sp.]
MNGTLHLWLIALFPLAGFAVNGLLGRKLPRAAVSAIALLATLVPLLLVGNIALHFRELTLPYVEKLATPWIQTSAFRADFAFSLDQLTLVMLSVVTGVGFLIHVYSVGYMEEEGYWRFFAYLNLFMFFMSVLVLSENFLLMFVGWEGVGLASYLLIGFYYTKKSAADAGKKAFIVNRIGDFGFLLAMFLLIAHFGTLSFSSVFGQLSSHPEWHGGFLTAISIFLILGATGKSAQIPLYVWLPDAMEGPTPVSALIHAATMVTAGVYMIVRAHMIFDRSPLALTLIAIIGAATALFAATIGLVQTDIKRVLAYSTVSQLGYMFLGCGVAAYSAAIFHLVTHAFFKGLLFLAAGSVIHALGGEQDLRHMGGLRRATPVTFWTMTAGVFAISGFFPFAGFFSKDAILFETFRSPNGGILLWSIGIFTAFLTSFYMFRLWYLAFFGKSRAEHAADHGHAHTPHESSWVMLGPLVILAILSVVGGWIGWPEALRGSDWFAHFLAPALNNAPPLTGASGQAAGAFVITQHVVAETTPHMERILSGLAVLIAALGWFVADTFYRRSPELPVKLAASFSGLRSLLVHKYWVDEIYQALIVRPLLLSSRFVLGGAVEGVVVQGGGRTAAGIAGGLGAILRRIQSGNIRSYAGWLAIGAAAMLLLSYFGFGTSAVASWGTHFKIW